MVVFLNSLLQVDTCINSSFLPPAYSRVAQYNLPLELCCQTTDNDTECRTCTFIHEESLAGENLIGHSDASRTESRLVQTVVFAQIGQNLCWLQTVSPGIITITDRQTKKGKCHKVLFQLISRRWGIILLHPRPDKSKLWTNAKTYMLYSVGSPQVALCRL